MTDLRQILVAVGLAALGLIGWGMWVLAREAGRHRTELRDANARLRSIIDSAVDGIVVIDSAGRIEAFNRGAERLFGYPEPDALGRNISMLMPSPYHEEHDGYLARYLTTGEARIIGSGRRVTGRRRDGTTFPVHLSVGEMTIAGERKFTGVLHDLSERGRLEDELRASEARWRAVIDSAVDGIIVIDAHGRIESFNPAAERLFGYAASEVAGLNVNTLMPSPYHEEHDVYLSRYVASGARKIIGTGREVTGLRKDGSTFPLHLSVGEMNVDGERKFTGIIHDLESRVRMEGQLREQSTLARLGEMAAVIAHEVRNPMAGIRAAMQVIGGRLPAGSRDVEMIAQIVARIDALNNLMKDLLMFARPPTPRFAPVDPRALVTATADLLSGDPAFRQVRVVATGDTPPILADPELLQIVFVNLLANGAQAMPDGGTIEVSVTATQELCTIAFTDQGSGIAAEIRDRIFMPFVTTKSRGTGLGLSTAKRLAEAHRGSITVSSPDAGGTTVTVHLPAGLAPPPPAGR